MYDRGTNLLDCVPWHWGQGARPKEFKCFDLKKKTAIRQVAQGEIYPLHSVGDDPYDFPQMGETRPYNLWSWGRRLYFL